MVSATAGIAAGPHRFGCVTGMQLQQRCGHEFALAPAGVWHRDAVGGQAQGAIEDYVEVERSVAICAVGIAVAVFDDAETPWQLLLEALESVKQCRRVESGVDVDPGVDKHVWRVKAPGLCHNQRRMPAGPFRKSLDSLDGCLDNLAGGPGVRADADVHSGRGGV